MTGIGHLKATAKRIVYVSGALTAFRRFRPATLTSVMFHRVLPPDDPRAKTADPAYTVSLETFEQCLDAMADWYEPVALEDVENACLGRSKLPRNALLVTFDDGWEDTARYAVPALQARGIPCVIFISTGAIGQENVPWRDVVACAWRAGTLALPPGRPATTDPLTSLLDWLDSLPDDERAKTLEKAIEAAGQTERPLMMSPQSLRQLADDGVGLGGHGTNHIPLTAIADPEQEFHDCRTEFERLTGRVPTSFAFPHGLYAPPMLQTVQRAGFKFTFTSDKHLNPLHQGAPTSPVFGRIFISEERVTDDNGGLCREKLAYWLTLQPVMSLS